MKISEKIMVTHHDPFPTCKELQVKKVCLIQVTDISVALKSRVMKLYFIVIPYDG